MIITPTDRRRLAEATDDSKKRRRTGWRWMAGSRAWVKPATMVAAALGVCFFWTTFRGARGDGHRGGRIAAFFADRNATTMNHAGADTDHPLFDPEELDRSRQAARRGLVPWGGLGPRPPRNARERRLANIPEYFPKKDVVFYSHIHKTSGTSISFLLEKLFPSESIFPTSHPYAAFRLDGLKNRNASWWRDYQVMYSHNRPNVTDEIGIPPTKRLRLLLAVRNPLLQMASVYFESVCRYGLHVKDGKIDQEEATLVRMNSNALNARDFHFCRDPYLWVGSEQFCKVYRNFQSSWLSYGGAEKHPCIHSSPEFNIWRSEFVEDGDHRGGMIDCEALQGTKESDQIWEDYFERVADSGIQRLEEALWVGVTERMEEARCLLILTLGKTEAEMGVFRRKEPRPVAVWDDKAMEKAADYDRGDWKLFEAANDILDLRLWTAKERLKHAGEDERKKLGNCFKVLREGGAKPEAFSG